MNKKITAHLHKLKEEIDKPYPFVDSNWKTAVLIGFCIFLFLYVFKPFRLDLYPGNKFFYTFGFGVVTVVCLFLDYFLLNLIQKKTKFIWTLWCEIIWDSLILCTIALGNGLYNNVLDFLFLKKENLQILPLWDAFLVTIPVGILFTIFFGLIKHARLKAQQKEELVSEDSEESNNREFICISSANKREPDVVLSVEDILYIESMGNLLKIHYLSAETKMASRVIRNTLKNLAALDHPDLYRCHRSFVLNLHKINQVSGNSNGYTVKLTHGQEEIPVSRKYAADFIRLYNPYISR